MSLPAFEDFRREFLGLLGNSKAIHFGLRKVGLVYGFSSSNKGSEAESRELLCEGASSM